MSGGVVATPGEEPTLGAISPRGGPVQDPVLTSGAEQGRSTSDQTKIDPPLTGYSSLSSPKDEDDAEADQVRVSSLSREFIHNKKA